MTLPKYSTHSLMPPGKAQHPSRIDETISYHIKVLWAWFGTERFGSDTYCSYWPCNLLATTYPWASVTGC